MDSPTGVVYYVGFVVGVARPEVFILSMISMVCVPFYQVLSVFDRLLSVAVFKVECLKLLDFLLDVFLSPIYPFASSSLGGLGKCLGIFLSCVGIGHSGVTVSVDVRFVVLSVGYGMF